MNTSRLFQTSIETTGGYMGTNGIYVCVEADNKPDQWMVVIREGAETGRLIGVPLRGVSFADALNAQKPLAYAFSYGLAHARAETSRFLNRSNTLNTPTPTEPEVTR